MKTALEYASNVLAFMCLGSIVDYFANTTPVCALVGLGVGFVVATIIHIISKKKGK